MSTVSYPQLNARYRNEVEARWQQFNPNGTTTLGVHMRGTCAR